MKKLLDGKTRRTPVEFTGKEREILTEAAIYETGDDKLGNFIKLIVLKYLRKGKWL